VIFATTILIGREIKSQGTRTLAYANAVLPKVMRATDSGRLESRLGPVVPSTSSRCHPVVTLRKHRMSSAI